MRARLSADFVARAIGRSLWDFGNRVLYDLCANHPHHDEDEVIVAKVWLIGRSYAAAIERRRDHKSPLSGDAFYERTVAPKIRKSGIDRWFRSISDDGSNDIALTLRVHKKLMDLFGSISGLEKRSLASKYLHFHFPGRYYIFDSRAMKGIQALTTGVGRNLHSIRNYDETYTRFYLRAQILNAELNSLVGRSLSPRDVDKVLLAWDREPNPALPRMRGERYARR